MTKLISMIIASAAVLYAASASAQCPMHKEGIIKGYDGGLGGYTANPDVQAFIEEIKATHDATILLTTHYMEEAQHLCDEVAIMDHGRIIARGAPEAMIRDHCEGVTVVLPRSSFRQPLETP